MSAWSKRAGAGELSRRRLLGLAGGAALAAGPWRLPTIGQASSTTRHELITSPGGLTVFDIGAGYRKIGTIGLDPAMVRAKGICCSASTGQLYVSYSAGGGSPPGGGAVLRYDLRTGVVRWNRAMEELIPGGESGPLDVSHDGAFLYLANAGNNHSNWLVVATDTGRTVATVDNVGAQPHNTVTSLDGRWVYLGAKASNYLHVLDPTNNRVVRAIGPLGGGGPAGGGGVKPFTINGRQTRAFINLAGLLGFEVADLTTDRRLFRIDLQDWGFNWPVRALFGPSHGISLSPDETELYVIDQPNNMVHVFDVRGVAANPPRRPTLTASMALQGSITGREPSGLLREGWLRHTLSGRYVAVGDAGDIIDTRSRRTVRLLPATLAQTRVYLQVDFDSAGRPVATSTRAGLGRVTG